jgi:serine/threonine-protein kinase RsbT
VQVERNESLPIASDEDIVRVRQVVRARAVECGFGSVDQTKLMTAASELARNALKYGGGGTARLELVSEGVRRGLRLIVEDEGPGIPDLELALKDGYSTGNGLGLGLGGARRLVNDFEISSRVGEGTRVGIVKWR